ncbi:glycoside hydrolase family 32 protein [Stackebrandtia nassauensis]|uniref:Glycosyl hydrolase family 32 domain protein n=1 Tax=Stackebrandtia nassauensis (strain DSM 44728 / CIP 108903 / NRRL B-16338 / NBRC 102104 / LLR-40K-21) TaxID=446470 RepID=D3PWR2_STANL|nr:glycoside hydrolase family 32 protein [Stackebrandtia nassauensis]ADD43284.1 Glycosyl hydrolase family 32 domain protein [Stackebrandtia nassauensis DSM 44728]
MRPRLSRRQLLMLSATVAGGTGMAALGVAPAFAADYPEFPYPDTDYQEPTRGQFHFSSQGGWMNDINAPLYYDGTYHLFYQHNPHGLTWDTMHWGHATSPDLVHWTQQPIALEPGIHPGDLWSGAGLVDFDNHTGLQTSNTPPIVVFSGTNGVRLFYSNDRAKTFQTYDNGNPIATPAGTSRDPKVFWHTGTNEFKLVIWTDAGGNGVDIFSSPNLLDWTFKSRFAADWLFECPDLFPLPYNDGYKWVLNDASGDYVVGTFDGTSFNPETTVARMVEGRGAFDGTFYAGLTFAHPPGDRIIQMLWMPGNRGDIWTGCATFPVELALRETSDGPRVTRNPIAAIEGLRFDTHRYGPAVVDPGQAEALLRDVVTQECEIIAEFDADSSTATRFGFRLDVNEDGSGGHEVLYDKTAQTLYGAALPTSEGKVRMRLLVDRNHLEIFGNDGTMSYIDSPSFSTSDQTYRLRLYADGGTVSVASIAVHDIARTWS